MPVLAAVLALAACDGGTDAPVPASISVTPPEATIEAIGGIRQFAARVLEADGDVIQSADVVWTSSDPGVATVDNAGLVTAIGVGTATISASAGSARGSALVTVAAAAFGCLPPDGTPVQLDVGALLLVHDPSDFCLTFPGEPDHEYLVGIQSVEENGEVRTPVVVSSVVAPTAAPARVAGPSRAPAPAADRAGRGSLRGDARDGGARRLRRWRDEHTDRMRRDVAYLASYGGTGALKAPAPQRAVIRPDMQIGDRVTLRVRKAGAQCNLGDFDEVEAQLVWKGEKAWWFEDVDNPDAFGLGDWQELGDRFDQDIDPVATRYFGEPNDRDGNGVIAVLFTKILNERGEDGEGVSTLGFVNPCDFLPRSTWAASNDGEFFYHIAADPRGAVGDTISVEDIKPLASFVIGHEYTHIIQFSRRFAAGAPLMDLFMAEGQATLSEEVVGHEVLGNRPDQNYGVDTAFRGEGFDWYSNAFIDLFYYYGMDLDGNVRVPEAPEQCTWTSEDTPDVCKGRALWYGVTWSLLRWVSDQYGDRFPGGEAELQRRLVASDRTGFDNLSDVVGESTGTLLGLWAPTLYVDDRVPGLDPRLRMTSWNLLDIYEGLNPDLLDILQPRPRPRTTSNWSDSFTVRSPSFEWYTITTTGQPAAIRATGSARQVLPGHMQMFVVRTR